MSMQFQTETLDEDMMFLEALMNWPRAWDMQQKILSINAREESKRSKVEAVEEDGGVIRANMSKKDKPYREYFSELTRYELDLLYSAYFNDFRVFGYDPCEDLM